MKLVLTPAQRKAVDLLGSSRQHGVLTSSKTVMVGRQPWIHWMTAYALCDKGVVHIRDYGEESAQVVLLEGPWRS